MSNDTRFPIPVPQDPNVLAVAELEKELAAARASGANFATISRLRENLALARRKLPPTASPSPPVGTTAPRPAPRPAGSFFSPSDAARGVPRTSSTLHDVGLFLLLTSPALVALGVVYLLPRHGRRGRT